jgi:hypothetical protein
MLGIGCFPGTLLGANVDAQLMLHMANYPNFKTHAMLCQIILSHIAKRNLLDLLGKDIWNGNNVNVGENKDPFFGFKTYMDNWERDHPRFNEALLAERRLKSVGIDIGNLALSQAGRNFLEKLPQRIKDVRVINAEQRAYIVSNVIELVRTLKLGKVKFKPAYEWMTELKMITTDEPIDNFKGHKISPFITADQPWLDVALKLGCPPSGLTPDMRPTRIMTVLRHDTLMPKGWSEENFYRMLTHPKIVENIGNLSSLILAMGGSIDTAAQVVSLVSSLNLDSFHLSLSVAAFSFKDTFLPNFNMTAMNAHRFVETPVFSIKSVDDYILHSSFLYSILLNSVTGKWSKLILTSTKEAIYKMLTELAPRYLGGRLLTPRNVPVGIGNIDLLVSSRD